MCVEGLSIFLCTVLQIQNRHQTGGVTLDLLTGTMLKLKLFKSIFRNNSDSKKNLLSNFPTLYGNQGPPSYDHLLTSPVVLRRLQYFHNHGKIVSHLTPSIESFQETHFWPCIIHGYSSPTLAQRGSALSQSPSQDISL